MESQNNVYLCVSGLVAVRPFLHVRPLPVQRCPILQQQRLRYRLQGNTICCLISIVSREWSLNWRLYFCHLTTFGSSSCPRTGAGNTTAPEMGTANSTDEKSLLYLGSFLKNSNVYTVCSKFGFGIHFISRENRTLCSFFDSLRIDTYKIKFLNMI